MKREELLQELTKELTTKEIGYSFNKTTLYNGKEITYIQTNDDIKIYINNLIKVSDADDFTFKENEFEIDGKVFVKYEDIEMVEVEE